MACPVPLGVILDENLPAGVLEKALQFVVSGTPSHARVPKQVLSVTLELWLVTPVTSLYEALVQNFPDVAFDPSKHLAGRTPMFEQEIEMEKRESSVVPILLIVAMIVLIVGVAGYYVWQNKQVIATSEAGNVISASLKNQTATLRFHTGLVKPSVAERPDGPQYRLLEKAGYVKLGKPDAKGSYPISITLEGEQLVSEIPNASKSKEQDGTDLYVFPLAERRLVEISNITMASPTRANVEFSWKWEPTKLGDLFDAAGPTVKGFDMWDRTTLIDKYGAAFYHANPEKVRVALSKSDQGQWQIAVE